MGLSNALLHRPPRSIDLGALPTLGLREHGQQNDSPSRRDPIRHPNRPSDQKEPQLAELAVQLARVRLVQQRAELGEPVDMETGTPFRLLVELEIPVPNFRFELDLALGHSVHAISPSVRSPARDTEWTYDAEIRDPHCPGDNPHPGPRNRASAGAGGPIEDLARIQRTYWFCTVIELDALVLPAESVAVALSVCVPTDSVKVTW
jgi:hypothetical protein